MFFTYVLVNYLTRKIYVGQTNNLENRIDRHNGKLPNKKTSFTFKNKKDGEWKLLYKEEFDTRSKAMIKEKELKSYQGRIFIKSLLSW